jgi:hypothetical protein
MGQAKQTRRASFDPCLTLNFHSIRMEFASDLLASCELGNRLGLTDLTVSALSDRGGPANVARGALETGRGGLANAGLAQETGGE